MGNDRPVPIPPRPLGGIGRYLGLMGLVVSLVGCRLPMSMSPQAAAPSDVVTDAASRPVEVPPLRGTVRFAARTAQATMTDIAAAASVSLIDTATNNTVATALTDANGRFLLKFGMGFTPSPTTTYYLEAFKGLSSNLPGHRAARVRTIALYNHGWTTITNAIPNDGIYLGSATTALSIGAALVNGNPAPFAFASLIGTLAPGSDAYAPVSGLSSSDFTELLDRVRNALATDGDPVASIAYDTASHTWSDTGAAIAITGLTPAHASIGSPVTVTGRGFSSTPSSNLVKFNGVSAAVTSSSATTLGTIVPAGAISGQVTVQVGTMAYLGPTFQVDTVLSSVSPNSGSPGTSVTITGTGFDETALGRNAVSFGGLAATVTAVTPTSLTVTVPSGAVTGRLTVTVAGSSGMTASDFVVPVRPTSFAPYGGPAGTAVTITGSGFASTVASNSVTFNGTPATITSASPTSLRVTAPAGTTGPIVVTVAGQSGSSSYPYVYGTPGPGAGATIQTYAGAAFPPPGALAANWALTPTGSGAFDSSGNLYVAADQVIYRITPAGAIAAVAGNGSYGYSGDNGPATRARLNSPCGVALDAAGNLYFADIYNHRIRRVDAGTGVITTVAGTGTSGYNADGIAATDAQLNYPNDVAVDAAGNIYIADNQNARIRMVDAATGVITTVAGTGAWSNYGDNLAATSAALRGPQSVALDAAGNLYIADTSNYRVRKVDAATGILTTVAGTGATTYNGDGFAATSAQLSEPVGVRLDGAGNLYIADRSDHRIRKVDAGSGIISTVAGIGTAGYSGDGLAATSAQLNAPQGVVVSAAGNVFVSDTTNKRLRKVTASTGLMTTVAGNGTTMSGDAGPATSAQLTFGQSPAMALDSAGNLYIPDASNHRVRKVSGATGVITTIAGTGTAGYNGDGITATTAQLYSPGGIALDAAGNLYIADSSNRRIRRVDAVSGLISTVAGTGASGSTGDGGAATSATLMLPNAVALDAAGNLYISDRAGLAGRIRKVAAATGIITTIAGNGTATYMGDGGPATAAGFRWCLDIATDGAGNVYLQDQFYQRVRKVDVATGIITTVAGTGTTGYSGDGGAATSATLSAPRGVKADLAGNLYIADSNNHVIRRVDAATGVITTVAGTGTANYSGDGGAAVGAQLNTPYSVLLDPAGNLYIVDANNRVVRKVH